MNRNKYLQTSTNTAVITGEVKTSLLQIFAYFNLQVKINGHNISDSCNNSSKFLSVSDCAYNAGVSHFDGNCRFDGNCYAGITMPMRKVLKVLVVMVAMWDNEDFDRNIASAVGHSDECSGGCSGDLNIIQRTLSH